jgi:hypothetical protein
LNPENLKKIYQGEGFINKIQFSAVNKWFREYGVTPIF